MTCRLAIILEHTTSSAQVMAVHLLGISLYITRIESSHNCVYCMLSIDNATPC